MPPRPKLSYNQFLNRAAIRSSVAVGTLMFTGDAIAQQLEQPGSGVVVPSDAFVRLPRWMGPSREPGEQRAVDADANDAGAGADANDAGADAEEPELGAMWNRTRSLRLGFIGLVSAGPISHWTYVLNAHFVPGIALKQLALKVFNVCAFNSPVQISVTFTLVTVLAGGTLGEAWAKIKRDFLRTYAVNNLYWPLILGANMRYVALPNQAAVGGVAHAFWNVFLAYMANQKEAKVKVDGAAGSAEEGDMEQALEREMQASVVHWNGEDQRLATEVKQPP